MRIRSSYKVSIIAYLVRAGRFNNEVLNLTLLSRSPKDVFYIIKSLSELKLCYDALIYSDEDISVYEKLRIERRLSAQGVLVLANLLW